MRRPTNNLRPGQVLRSRRQALGLTQLELAELAGVAQRDVSYTETAALEDRISRALAQAELARKERQHEEAA